MLGVVHAGAAEAIHHKNDLTDVLSIRVLPVLVELPHHRGNVHEFIDGSFVKAVHEDIEHVTFVQCRRLPAQSHILYLHNI